jgi:hypothetical protein
MANEKAKGIRTIEDERQKAEHEDLEKYYEEAEGSEDSERPMFYKGVFVGILKKYMLTHKRIKLSSFTHKNVEGYVVYADARIVSLKKSIDGKTLHLSQNSVKDVEEV